MDNKYGDDTVTLKRFRSISVIMLIFIFALYTMYIRMNSSDPGGGRSTIVLVIFAALIIYTFTDDFENRVWLKIKKINN